MPEKKYTGFAALYALDHPPADRKPGAPTAPARKTQEPSEIPETRGQHEVQTRGQQSGDVDSNLSTESNPVDSMLSTASTRGQQGIQPRGQQTGSTSYRQHKRKHETIRIREDILNKISVFCAQKGITKQDFWEILAVHYFAEQEQKLSTALKEPVDSMLSHDDMMIFTTHEDIIMRYEKCTCQKWTRRDDREGRRYNQVDIRLIEIAFISTVEKKLRGNTAKQPIKSFNYFAGEIDNLLEAQKSGELPANLDEYHKYVLSTWEKRIRPLRDTKWPKQTRAKD